MPLPSWQSCIVRITALAAPAAALRPHFKNWRSAQSWRELSRQVRGSWKERLTSQLSRQQQKRGSISYPSSQSVDRGNAHQRHRSHLIRLGIAKARPLTAYPTRDLCSALHQGCEPGAETSIGGAPRASPDHAPHPSMSASIVSRASRALPWSWAKMPVTTHPEFEPESSLVANGCYSGPDDGRPDNPTEPTNTTSALLAEPVLRTAKLPFFASRRKLVINIVGRR